MLILVPVLTYLVIVFYSGFDKFFSAFSKINLFFIPLLFVLAFGNYVARFVKWHYFCQKSNILVDKAINFKIFMAGLAMSFTPLKAGDLLKSHLLKTNADIEYSKSAPLVFVERLTDMIAMLVLAAVGMVVFNKGWVLLAITAALVMLVIVLLQNKRLVLWLLSLFKFGFAEKIRESYLVASKLVKVKPLIIAVIISIFSWYLECLALFFTLKALGFSISMLSAIFVFAFSTIAGTVSALPGGVGVSEASLYGLLVYFSVPAGVAAASTIVIRIVTLWFAVGLGSLNLVRLARVNKTLKKDLNKTNRMAGNT